jgi:2-dehydro-3-deoxygluconokinase
VSAPIAAPVLTLGETMLLLTSAVPIADADDVRVDSGGAESNVAIGLAKRGVPVRWLGRVGDDPAGERVLRDVAGEGVEVIAIRDPERSTGLMMKERLGDGRTRVTYHRRGSAGSALTSDDVEPGLVERSSLVHLTGITCALSASAHDTVLAVARRATAAGVPVSFDVNHRAKLIDPATARDRYRAVIALADVVHAGDDEARLVLDLPERDGDEDDLARRLADLAGGTAVVKLGSRGAVVAVDGIVHRRAATPVRVVDPVGAGDAFVAGWIAATLAGATTTEALDAAADAGARACTVAGDWGHDPAAPLPLLDRAELAASDTGSTALHDHVDR